MVKQVESEQQPRKSNMINNNNSSSNSHKEDKDRYLGVAIHSQVKKIKQEMEKIKHPALQQQLEMRPVLKEITPFRQRSRSPLGFAEKRPISVGN